MKLFTISLLVTLAVSRLEAAVDPISANVIPVDPKQGTEWSLVTRTAQQQFKQHKLAEAAQSAKQALAIARHYPSPDGRPAINYYQLGNIYRDWGHCAEARTNYSRAIATWEKLPGTNPKFLFNTIVSLIGSMCECEDFSAADKTFRKFETKLQGYQSDADDQAELLAIRGLIFRAQKNYPQAEAYYRRSIQLREQTAGMDPVEIEEERANLAMVIDRQGRHEEALAESKHVIDFFEHRSVSRPATLAGALNNAACSLADLGRLPEAQGMFERALTVAVGTFGEDTRVAARIMLNYARVLRENHQSPAAQAMQQKGAEAFRRALVRDNATVDLADLK